jgi:hypothetical protein
MTEIKTTSRTVLRRMRRDCDRNLAAWDLQQGHVTIVFGGFRPVVRECECSVCRAMLALDARRCEIRERLKART